MKAPVIIIGVLLFAAVTALLVLWGMRKAYFQNENLTKMLLSKSADRIMQYLKTHETISLSEIKKLTEGIKASEFLSRKTAKVQSGDAFAAKLVDIMQRDGLIEPIKNKSNIYRSKKIGGK